MCFDRDKSPESSRLSNAGWEKAQVRPKRLRYAVFETPDIERALAYYLEVNGLSLVERSGTRAFLATRSGQVSIQLDVAQHARCARLGFELDPSVALDNVLRKLKDQGIEAQRRSDGVPGIGDIVDLTDPNGTKIELFSSWHDINATDTVPGIAPLKLGHVAFFTPNPAKVAEFYKQILGFRVSDWIEDFFVFMRCSPDHHSVNFLRGPTPRIHHFAFELRDASHIVTSCDVLAKRKIPLVWGPLRFGPGHNLAAFHHDPDGQNVELFAELDQVNDEALGYFEPRPWHSFTPQVPRIWTLKEDPVWGSPPPESFM